jgi:ABC-type cobalamin/Fe3+-siderophores transport system ATPase subunit
MKKFTDYAGIELENESKLNIILGKNGSGKSTLLRHLDQHLQEQSCIVRYITPERGGELTYDGSIDTNREHNPNWLSNSRRSNRFDYFRQSSMAEFRNLETLALRSIEKKKEIRSSSFTFDDEISKINSLLDRVATTRSNTSGFEIIEKSNLQKSSSENLSSGESELISLGIEILYFRYLCQNSHKIDKQNYLLLDEPDVHLHPDLQHRLMELLYQCVEDINCRIFIATHSTSIVSSLISLSKDTKIGFKEQDSSRVSFIDYNETLEDIIPIFGAHPLSRIFNQRPLLIVEGEDDSRIWEQAVRSSNGRVNVHPCVAKDVQSIKDYEDKAEKIIKSVYDNGRAYSLRDGDGKSEELSDSVSIVRLRLKCRSAENLMLTEDSLSIIKFSWEQLQEVLENWLRNNQHHPVFSEVDAFRSSGWDRKMHPIKPIRNLIVGLTGYSKPWEHAVGQGIANLNQSPFADANSLLDYLGPKIVTSLNLKT